MANFAVTPTDTTFVVQVGENTAAATASATLSQAWAEGTLPGGAGTKSARGWAGDAEGFADDAAASAAAADASFDGIAAALAVEGIGNGPAAFIKTLNPVEHPTVYRTDAGLQGWYTWDATYNRQRVLADPDEHIAFSPNTAVNGAWVRTNLSDKERNAINAAYRRVWEAWPQEFDNFDPALERIPALGRQVNWNSTSEDLSDAHYTKSGVTVESETTTYKGITLQRVLTSSSNYFRGIGDNRGADYDLEDGKLYIASCYAMAPIETLDAQGLRSPNAFAWMFQPTNGNSYASGAKLLFPTPRRIWSIVQGGSAPRTTKVLRDPTLPWSDAAQTQGGQSLQWLADPFGLGGNINKPEVWLGGMQLELAPNQTEKQGITVLGTSIDVSGFGIGNGKDHTSGARRWPRWLEGLLCAPIFPASIGGQTAAQIDARFNTDIAPLREHSKYIILAMNVNDFVSGFDSAAYRASWASIYAKALAAGWNEDEIIWTTAQQRSVFNYANGAADLAAENEYLKTTYRNVIDKGIATRDAIDMGLLPPEWENDGIHQYEEPQFDRALGFAIYHRYRHFFRFDNVPGPYQKTVNDDLKTQSFGQPIYDTLKGAARLDASVTAAVYRDTDLANAPVVIFEGTAGSVKTFQIPGPKYQRAAERNNREVLRQRIVNLTSDSQSLSIQYYQRDGSNTLTTLGGVFLIPAGTARTICTDGTAVWSESPALGASTGWTADTGTDRKSAAATYTAGTALSLGYTPYTPGAGLTFGATYTQSELTALATRLAAIETAVQAVGTAVNSNGTAVSTRLGLIETAVQNASRAVKAIKDALITARTLVP